AIATVWHQAFPNRVFWEWRYCTNPELGAGIGSRGEPLAEKRELLRRIIAEFQPAAVLDVGCGDCEATRGLSLGDYIGLDISPEAIRLARVARPDGTFEVGELDDHTLQAELTICLDVLIHQPEATKY